MAGRLSRTSPSILLGALLPPLLAGCAGGGGEIEAFPPMVRPGVGVYDRDARLHDAVQEYMEFRGLPISPDRMRTGVVTTLWFPVQELEVPPTPLAACPGPPPGENATPSYRARYRFSVLGRAGHNLFRVEAHWQKALVEAGREEWADCRSTGAWERETESSIILRAKMLAREFRGG